MPRGRRKEIRIPVSVISRITPVLFARDRFTGGDLARELEDHPNTVWSWFSRRGITSERAHAIASVLRRWSKELNAIAKTLDIVAYKAEAGHYLEGSVVTGALEPVDYNNPPLPPEGMGRGRPRRVAVDAGNGTLEDVATVPVPVASPDPVTALINGAQAVASR